MRTLPRSFSPACLAISVMLLGAPASAAPVRDQGQIFMTGGVVDLGTDDWSQSITTGITGTLTGIQFQIENDSLPLLPGVFDFALFDGDNPPMGAPLFSEQVTIPATSLYEWDVSGGNLFFEVGDVFTFAFSAQQTGFIFAGNDPPGYAGGELFKNGAGLSPDDTNDLAFITYVIPIPIPAAAWLFGSALALLGWLKRRAA